MHFSSPTGEVGRGLDTPRKKVNNPAFLLELGGNLSKKDTFPPVSSIFHQDIPPFEDVFSESGTDKSIHLTLITSNGVSEGSDTSAIHSQLTMDDLFAK